MAVTEYVGRIKQKIEIVTVLCERFVYENEQDFSLSNRLLLSLIREVRLSRSLAL